MNIPMSWHDDTLAWVVLGLLGQGVFFSRFMVQWIASERAKVSYIPVSFWYLSIVGSLLILVYSIHRKEPIIMLGYLPNVFVYTRNLMLIRRGEMAAGPPASGIEPRPAGSAGG